MFDTVEDFPDLYEHERVAARNCLGELTRRYSHVTNMGETRTQERFIREAAGIYGERNLLVTTEFHWRDEKDPDKFSPTVSDDDNDMNVYWLPRIRIVGRVDAVKEFDHDQQKREIQDGVFDGVKGVIDPNTGLMREDSKKKQVA